MQSAPAKTTSCRFTGASLSPPPSTVSRDAAAVALVDVDGGGAAVRSRHRRRPKLAGNRILLRAERRGGPGAAVRRAVAVNQSSGWRGGCWWWWTAPMAHATMRWQADRSLEQRMTTSAMETTQPSPRTCSCISVLFKISARKIVEATEKFTALEPEVPDRCIH
ncbi:hypothetical protein BRADI_4g44983v3 [Brachypodium distachyon]|uniref:Uncharacterized protein n=1 Tax=Brachypodium distachyon TaxID=15368 RepID=A0A0Q3LJB0_BRADI|nr:hypothetical protein BRADI_4g44983v3 [Brachypodium distachyon]KQJ92643.1 hypothetical protein BRADI_4g44983v3 [Brachypodium distachyon]